MKSLKFNSTKFQKYYSDFGVQLRLFILLTVAFLISINFLIFYFFFSLKKEYNSHNNHQMRVVGETFSQQVKKNITHTNRIFFTTQNIAYLESLQSFGIFSNIQIFDKNNDKIINFVNNLNPNEPFWMGLEPSQIKGILSGDRVFSAYYQNSSKQYFRAYYIPIFDTEKKIKIVIKIESEQNFLGKVEELSPLLVGLRSIGILAIVLITYLFIKSAIQPLRQLSEEVQTYRMAFGNPTEDEEVTGEMDLRLALKTFREMVITLQEKEKVLQDLYDSAEKKAEKFKNYNDYILASIASGVISFDTRGRITGFNKAAEKILGIPEEEVLHSSIDDLFNENEELIRILKHSLKKQKKQERLELNVKNNHGKWIWLSLGTSLLKDDDGNILGTTLLFTDLSEIKKLQEQINLKERLSALGEMAAGIAHEFRNSLAAITGYTRLMKKQFTDNSEAQELLQAITEESSSQEQIVRQFLDFTRPTSLNIEEIHLHSLISEVTIWAKSHLPEHPHKKYNLLTEYDKNEITLLGDTTLLKQVLSNIILNGIQAMPNGGDLKITTKLMIGINEIPMVEIRILDSGIGIQEDDTSRIFTPFFTTKKDGTGLGLALAHKIITQHNGSIDFLSDGNHTIFTINLPAQMAT